MILQKENLIVAAYKSFFHIKEVELLGYLMNDYRLKISGRKVEVVHLWEALRNLKDV
jgi:hypothetical protein